MAGHLLDAALALIEDGQYGEEVENYFDCFFKTPGLPKEDVEKALFARGKARNSCAERLFAKAQQGYLAVVTLRSAGLDFQAVVELNPLNRQARRQSRCKAIRLPLPAYQRAPPEIWEQIATHMPRYHLRTWLFISQFHREIASRFLFHTIDIYFGQDQGLSRGLELFDYAKIDPIFASRVKSLRLHWASEEGNMLDLMIRIFKTSLPAFKALQDFEWIGYRDMPVEMVQVLQTTHKQLRGLGFIGQHQPPGISAFVNLHRFTLSAGHGSGFADIRTLLDRNDRTLKHVTLGASRLVWDHSWDHSWDLTFESITINDLTHLDLVNTSISHFVLTRIAHAHNLQSLTLNGRLVDPGSASAMFAKDCIIDGRHTLLPRLEAFRFVLVDQHNRGLYCSVTRFLREREKLRMLDLGRCPWDLVRGILCDLRNLRVLGVHIHHVSECVILSLLRSIPTQMVAINLSVDLSEGDLNDYARHFTRCHTLSFLHLRSGHRPEPDYTSKKVMEEWISAARSIAATVPSLDFLAWNHVPYVIVRSHGDLGRTVNVEVQELPFSRTRSDCGRGVDMGGEDIAWLERKSMPMDYYE